MKVWWNLYKAVIFIKAIPNRHLARWSMVTHGPWDSLSGGLRFKFQSWRILTIIFFRDLTQSPRQMPDLNFIFNFPGCPCPLLSVLVLYKGGGLCAELISRHRSHSISLVCMWSCGAENHPRALAETHKRGRLN